MLTLTELERILGLAVPGLDWSIVRTAGGFFLQIGYGDGEGRRRLRRKWFVDRFATKDEFVWIAQEAAGAAMSAPDLRGRFPPADAGGSSPAQPEPRSEA